MANPKSRGRMIRKDISNSKSFASLSKNSQILFCLLLPHYSSHGKINGDPGFIKAEVCPRIGFLTAFAISKCLLEISEKTNVKWFHHDGLKYIHATNWLEHQSLDPAKVGTDTMPNYETNSGLTPDLLLTKSNHKPKPKYKPISFTPEFDRFWELYTGPNKTPNAKVPCYKLWESLTEEEQLLAIEKLPLYINQASELKYIAKPSRYLGEKMWELEFKKPKDQYEGMAKL